MSSASSSSSRRVRPGSPRRASAARTCWGEARSSLRSITELLLGQSEGEAAVAAIQIGENLEVQTPRRGVHTQDVKLGVQRYGADQTDDGAAHYVEHLPAVGGDGRVEDVATGRRQRDGRERRDRRLQTRYRAEMEGRGGEQPGPAGRVEVEREVQAHGRIGSHGQPILDRIRGWQ